MNLNNKTIPGILSHLWASLHGNGFTQKLAYVEPPLRAELFCADQMEQHGKTLAESRMLSPGHAPDRLLARLAKNEGILMYRARGSIASLFFRLEAIPAEDIESGTPSC